MSLIPKDKYNYLGVEIEYCSNIPRTESRVIFLEEIGQDIAEVGSDNSICVLGVSGRTSPIHLQTTHINTCSVSGGELRLLIREDKIDEVTNKLEKAFQRIPGIFVNNSCGLHVHIDCRYREKEILFHNLVEMQDVLFKMQPNERTKSDFCTKNDSKEFEANPFSKYRAVNKYSYDKYQTIEVRLAAGTLDTRKIKNYLHLLTKIANKKTKIETTPRGSLSSKKALNLNIELTRYIRDEINYNRQTA